MADFDAIALLRSERGLVTGGTGSGKSTLAEYLLLDFVRRYPTGRVVIADSKPRFRAEYELTGLKATRRYKRWDHGTYIPGSVVGDLTRPDAGLEAAWRMGARIVILQTNRTRDLGDILKGLNHFFEQARSSRPQMIYVDEIADFFGSNGQPVPGLPIDYRDIILRTARAGRELGLALLASMQRPKGVPKSVVQELTKLYLFRLDNVDDMGTLWDLGIPTTVEPPLYDHEFRFWERHKESKLLALDLDKGNKAATA